MIILLRILLLALMEMVDRVSGTQKHMPSLQTAPVRFSARFCITVTAQLDVNFTVFFKHLIAELVSMQRVNKILHF